MGNFQLVKLIDAVTIVGAKGSTGSTGSNGSTGATGSTGTTGSFTTPRVASTTSSATPAPNADTTDQFELTAQTSTASFGAPTTAGSVADGQKMIVQVIPGGTGQALSWSGATGGYTGTTGVPLPLTTGATGTILNIGFMYVTANSLNKWLCIASVQQ